MTARIRRPVLLGALGALAAALLTGCGDTTGDADGEPSTTAATGEPVSIRLLTHESFAVSDEVLAEFTEATGITVELIRGGDAGTVVNQAILARGNPQADVLFGIDSTYLTRALEADIFVPYEPPALDEVDADYLLDPEHRVIPVDYGDVCLNYDRAWFGEHDLAVPSSLEDLTDPAYRGLLAVENPATSSTGLAFLLATIADQGEDDWTRLWEALRSNDVTVTDGWEDAYYGEFSGGSGSEGTKPLVVSYASSPPAEVIYADPPVSEAPTGVITAGCYRQVEGAGILAGTDHEAAARRLIDFLLSEPFQADVALSMFVYPVRDDVALPEVFVEHAVEPDEVAELDPADIATHREDWIDTWTDIVLR